MTPFHFLAAGAAAAVIYLAATGRKVVLGNGGPLQVAPVGNGQYLRPDAAEAFNRMVEQAQAEGVQLRAGSGFRSVIEQAAIYAKWKAGLYNVPAVAPPGKSNHGWGIAVDVADTAGRSLSYGSAGYSWLMQFATAYGFGWTEGGKINEPWHWVYEA